MMILRDFSGLYSVWVLEYCFLSVFHGIRGMLTKFKFLIIA